MLFLVAPIWDPFVLFLVLLVGAIGYAMGVSSALTKRLAIEARGHQRVGLLAFKMIACFLITCFGAAFLLMAVSGEVFLAMSHSQTGTMAVPEVLFLVLLACGAGLIVLGNRAVRTI